MAGELAGRLVANVRAARRVRRVPGDAGARERERVHDTVVAAAGNHDRVVRRDLIELDASGEARLAELALVPPARGDDPFAGRRDRRAGLDGGEHLGDGACPGKIHREEVETGLSEMVVRVVEAGDDGEPREVVLHRARSRQGPDRRGVADCHDPSVLDSDRLGEWSRRAHRPDARVEEDDVRNVPGVNPRERRRERVPRSTSDRRIRQPRQRHPGQERSRSQQCASHPVHG